MTKNSEQRQGTHEARADDTKISFLIPALNEERWIGDCLRSIAHAHDPRVREIIVIDNGSTDATAEIAASFPGVTVLREPRKGVSRARQRGLDAVSGELVACIDADSRLPEGWVDSVCEKFDDPALTCLIGRCEYFDLAVWKRWIIRTALKLLVLFHAMCGKNALYAHGGNAIYRTRILREAGGFNTHIDFYGEDVDTMMRMTKHGKVTFDPSFTVNASARRINAEGFWHALLLYRINAIWQRITKKPLIRRKEVDWR